MGEIVDRQKGTRLKARGSWLFTFHCGVMIYTILLSTII
jgi:hypothetical protein